MTGQTKSAAGAHTMRLTPPYAGAGSRRASPGDHSRGSAATPEPSDAARSKPEGGAGIRADAPTRHRAATSLARRGRLPAAFLPLVAGSLIFTGGRND